jgi:hypothetical protein
MMAAVVQLRATVGVDTRIELGMVVAAGGSSTRRRCSLPDSQAMNSTDRPRIDGLNRIALAGLVNLASPIESSLSENHFDPLINLPGLFEDPNRQLAVVSRRRHELEATVTKRRVEAFGRFLVVEAWGVLR